MSFFRPSSTRIRCHNVRRIEARCAARSCAGQIRYFGQPSSYYRPLSRSRLAVRRRLTIYLASVERHGAKSMRICSEGRSKQSRITSSLQS